MPASVHWKWGLWWGHGKGYLGDSVEGPWSSNKYWWAGTGGQSTCDQDADVLYHFIEKDVLMCMSLVLLYQLLWQNPSQKNNMKKKQTLIFHSVWPCNYSRKTWWQESEVTGFVIPIFRRKREMIVPISLFLLYFLSSSGPQDMEWCCLHLGWLFLSLLHFCEKFLKDKPGNLPHVDSQN